MNPIDAIVCSELRMKCGHLLRRVTAIGAHRSSGGSGSGSGAVADSEIWNETASAASWQDDMIDSPSATVFFNRRNEEALRAE